MAPQGRMRGELAAAARVWVISASPPLISQRSGPLTASVSALRAASDGCASTRACGRSPAGEADAIAKKMIWRGCEPPSLPPRGKVAPQGRMRGELAAAARVWVISASPPLISQRSGPLTASVSALRAASGGCASTRACGRSPAGEAARRKKSAKTILTCTCFCGKLIVVKKAATGSRPSAHLEGLQKPRVIP